jgi:hypothetical protein
MAKKKTELVKDVASVKAPLPTESIIQAEGEAHDSPFPADAKINDYGFLGFKKSWFEDLGWTKGMALKIEKNADNSITLRKA